VNLHVGRELSGVSRAIVGQATAALETKLPIDFWIVNPDRQGTEQGIRYLRFRTGPLGLRISRLFKARILSEQPELDDYDVVLLRYPMAVDLDPLAFLRHRRAKVVTVHHTKEVDEILSTGRSAGILARAALERFNGPRVLSGVAGIVAVTDEIRRYELERAGRDMLSRVIANGIDVSRVRQLGFAPFDGRNLRMLFVASSHAPWHGTDRLLASLRRYAGPVRLHLHMVGRASGAPPGTVEQKGPLTVVHHGLLDGDALSALFRDSTLAFASLAMFRAGLDEGCVLKTREYIARGMPFVYGYRDVDLLGAPPFCHNVGNSDAPFDLDPLIAFAESVSREPRLSDEMRSFATRHLDWKVKMGSFYDFAKEVA